MAKPYQYVYDSSLCISAFVGIEQGGSGYDMDLKYAVEAENCDTTGGALCALRAPVRVMETLPKPIGTLARLYRRYYANDSVREVMIAAAGGGIYAYIPGELAPQWKLLREGFLCDDWDTVSYEVNPAQSAAPVDVLLLSNAKDGMICVYGNDLHVENVPTPKKYGVMTRHAERIWGGGMVDDPDMLGYSAPFNPFDWAQNNATPEDGAGDLMHPSWDGDGFVALKSFGGYMIAFKHGRVWRLAGTNPGEYVFQEQLGGGVRVENTIADVGARLLFLGADGLCAYDGTQVYPFDQNAIREIWKRVHYAALDHACAAYFKQVYYLALPIDQSPCNNVVLRYHVQERRWMMQTLVRVQSFCVCEDRLLFTSATTPGAVYEMDAGDPLPIRWVTSWQTMGAQNVTKEQQDVYVSCECANDIAVEVGIETERGVQKKRILFNAGVKKPRKVHFSRRSRRFRLILSCESAYAWRVVCPVQVDFELDAD